MNASRLKAIRIQEKSGGRKNGRTTRLIEEALKDPNHIFLCHNGEFAKELRKNHPGLNAIGPLNPDAMRGTNKNYFIDDYYMELLWERQAENAVRIMDILKQSIANKTKGGAK